MARILTAQTRTRWQASPAIGGGRGTACSGSDVLSYEDVYGFTFKTSSDHSACVFDVLGTSFDPRVVCLGFLTSDLGWQRAWPTCRRGRLCSILVHVMLVR